MSESSPGEGATPDVARSRLAGLTAQQLEREVGHPGHLWAQLLDRVRRQGHRRFSDVQDDFLGVVWCLDRYRVAGVPPRGMGDQRQSPQARLAGVYRAKGNWFAELIASLLGNQTSSPLASRSNVQGFSQLHQIDVAWPARGALILDPLVCAETKMTGAPAFGATPARRATSD